MKVRLWLLLGPMVIWCLGVVMNVAVISANQGMMPVVVPLYAADQVCSQPGCVLDDSHVRYAKDTHLKILGDWIRIPHSEVASPGDILLDVGDVTQTPGAIAFVALLLFRKRD
jgi:Family of unknown function (DUF5317)